LSLKSKLENIAGKESVNVNGALSKYASDESPFKGVVPNYEVKATTSAQVREIINLARKEKTPVVPSSSTVHFNGAALPLQGGIVIDLSGMDKIKTIDERNRKVIFEPGVTWGTLASELSNKDLRMFNPLFPHSGTSALTSLLEREPAIIPKFEYADPIMTLEAVLPNGELMRTGSSSITLSYDKDDVAVDMVCPYGPGMDFFRLFHGAQGTLGVVTWVAVKLEHLSPLKKLFIISCSELEKAVRIVHSIQNDMIGQECFILDRNDAGLILSRGDIARYGELKNGLSNYNIIMVLRGGKRRPEEKIAYEEEALREMLGKELDGGDGIRSDDKNWMLENLGTNWPQGSAYWKNLLKGKVFQIAYKTTLKNIDILSTTFKKIITSNGFDINDCGLYVQPLEYGRAYHCEHHLYYAPEGEDFRKKLVSLYEELAVTLANKGAFFNQPYGPAVQALFDKTGGYREAVKKVKTIFDPAGIMNPGKLTF